LRALHLDSGVRSATVCTLEAPLLQRLVLRLPPEQVLALLTSSTLGARLLELDLSNCGFNDDNAAALVAARTRLPLLRRLVMNQNTIRSAGTRALLTLGVELVLGDQYPVVVTQGAHADGN
jgi:hypothetical protein